MKQILQDIQMYTPVRNLHIGEIYTIKLDYPEEWVKTCTQSEIERD